MHIRDFEPLLAGEQTLLAGLSSGKTVPIGGTDRPDAAAGPERQIRAAFLRELVLDRMEGLEKSDARVHEKGVRIMGARITGVLDLEGCRIPRDLALIDCHFDVAPVLRSAVIDNLILNGSRLPGLGADRLEAQSSVFLRGADVEGTVRLLSATLSGDLDFSGAKFRGGADRVALNADGLAVKGSVAMRGTEATGAVQLGGATVGGDLDCVGARLKAHAPKKALALEGAKITGSFILRNGAKVDGVLDMTEAEIGSLADEAASWPGPRDLVLNRCRYGAFTGRDIDADARIRWLSLQDEVHWGDDFWPQPWEHLAKVLREMGHRVDARKVLIEKEKRQRRALRARRRKALLFEDAIFASVWDRMLGATVRYGHQPLLAFVWLALFWLVGLIVFAGAEAVGAIKPNQPVVLRGAEWVQCANPDTTPDPKTRLACFFEMPAARSYPGFNAAIYSADTLLPIVDLEMQGYWIPDDRASTFGRLARAYLWLHIALGWALSLLAVAGFSGLIRTDGK